MAKVIKNKAKTIKLSGGVKVTLRPHLTPFAFDDAEEIKERLIYALGRQVPSENEGRVIYQLSSPQARRIGSLTLLIIATEKIEGADFEMPGSWHDDNLVSFYTAFCESQSISPDDLRAWIKACEDHNAPPGDPAHAPESIPKK